MVTESASGLLLPACPLHGPLQVLPDVLVTKAAAPQMGHSSFGVCWSACGCMSTSPKDHTRLVACWALTSGPCSGATLAESNGPLDTYPRSRSQGPKMRPRTEKTVHEWGAGAHGTLRGPARHHAEWTNWSRNHNLIPSGATNH